MRQAVYRNEFLIPHAGSSIWLRRVTKRKMCVHGRDPRRIRCDFR